MKRKRDNSTEPKSTVYNFEDLKQAVLDDNIKLIQNIHQSNKNLICSLFDKGATLMHLAAQVGKTEVIKVLHELNPSLIKVTHLEGFTSMHLAAQYNNTEAIKVLHALNPSLIKQRIFGELTPMHTAAQFNKTEAIKVLHALDPNLIKPIILSYPSLANVRISEKLTPMHVAAQYNNTEAIKVLHELDPSLIKQRIFGELTPMHLAAEFDRTEAIKVLHALDPSLIKLVTQDRYTPMHIAAGYGKTEAIKILHALDPSLIYIERNGFTAIDNAIRFNHLEAVKLLYEYDTSLIHSQHIKNIGKNTTSDTTDLFIFIINTFSNGSSIKSQIPNANLILDEAIKDNNIKIIYNLIKYGITSEIPHELITIDQSVKIISTKVNHYQHNKGGGLKNRLKEECRFELSDIKVNVENVMKIYDIWQKLDYKTSYEIAFDFLDFIMVKYNSLYGEMNFYKDRNIYFSFKNVPNILKNLQDKLITCSVIKNGKTASEFEDKHIKQAKLFSEKMDLKVDNSVNYTIYDPENFLKLNRICNGMGDKKQYHNTDENGHLNPASVNNLLGLPDEILETILSHINLLDMPSFAQVKHNNNPYANSANLSCKFIELCGENDMDHCC